LGFGVSGFGFEGVYVAAAHDEQARPLAEAVYLLLRLGIRVWGVGVGCRV